MAPHLVMIAGGTGITPMYQIIKSSIKTPGDKTRLSLIYANIQEDDICMFCTFPRFSRISLMRGTVLKKEIDELQAKSNGRFDVKVCPFSPLYLALQIEPN